MNGKWSSAAGLGCSAAHPNPNLSPLFSVIFRIINVSPFFFNDIPASNRNLRPRSFIFDNIPGLFLHFLKSLVFPFTVRGNILSQTALHAVSSAGSNSPQIQLAMVPPGTGC